MFIEVLLFFTILGATRRCFTVVFLQTQQSVSYNAHSGLILAKYLNLPVVLNVRWVTRGEGHFVLAPSPLSYIPVPGSGLTDKMDFIQRLKNIFFYSIITFQEKMVLPIYDKFCSKYIEGGCNIFSLLQQADIWLFRSDFVFDFPRPTMPNVVYIGGFQCKPAEPLPADLENHSLFRDAIGGNTLQLFECII
uniref:Uncharacterized protein n=1 Tax=Oryzias sinensis TaxID=183150 RepID=A0A8C7WXR7_9TELE